MFYFPDSDTGYREDERAYLDEDAHLEAQLTDEKDLFDYEAEEMQKTLWAGPLVPYADDTLIALPLRCVRSNQKKEVA